MREKREPLPVTAQFLIVHAQPTSQCHVCWVLHLYAITFLVIFRLIVGNHLNSNLYTVYSWENFYHVTGNKEPDKSNQNWLHSRPRCPLHMLHIRWQRGSTNHASRWIFLLNHASQRIFSAITGHVKRSISPILLSRPFKCRQKENSVDSTTEMHQQIFQTFSAENHNYWPR